MVCVGVFLGIFTGVIVGLQIFGMRVYTLAATKLTATEDARKTLNVLRGQIRSAKLVYVGTYANGAFSRIADGLPQTGNALEIYFYRHQQHAGRDARRLLSSDGRFQKWNIQRQQRRGQFDGQLCDQLLRVHRRGLPGHILTTYDNNPVIRVTMQFLSVGISHRRRRHQRGERLQFLPAANPNFPARQGMIPSL